MSLTYRKLFIPHISLIRVSRNRNIIIVIVVNLKKIVSAMQINSYNLYEF